MVNRKTLLWASFFTLIAAGMGFAIRAGLLGDWAQQFGFTKGELGTITGGGLTGFGVVILLGSLFVDKVGYKPILFIAFVLHIISAVITVAATPVFEASGKDAAYWCLFIGMFMFAIANGLCEAVINPLVATLYPKEKTHYLNILHAGWPGGLILGATLAYAFAGDKAHVTHMRWEIPMLFFLAPVAIFGLMILKQKFPHSEAKAAGVDFVTMLKEFAAPVLLLLFLLHAMVGYVELGTDSWIVNILKSVIPGQEVLLFIYTSAIMFVLRFFAGPIVHRINPVGLLFISAILGCLGLYWLSYAETLTLVILAATTYGVGKTFLWPTMLGVVGERFPKGGALTMGTIGGIGMLSAGLLGGPGIGYKQDYYASQQLEQEAEPTYKRYVSADEKSFLMFPAVAGLDGAKVGTLEDDGKELAKRLKVLEDKGEKPEQGKELDNLSKWWKENEKYAEDDKKPVKDAGIFGGRMALRWTAVVPLAMAVGYLLLILYFRSKGGYKQEDIEGNVE
ncbi:MAG: MFS transporter [Planctomycetes bacterium]|nr:MFS transporter [Planctomycetota bacterium]